jgi:arylsulfatase A-like enzyme
MDDDEALVHTVQELPSDDGSRHFICFHLMSVHQMGTFHDCFAKYQPMLNMDVYPRKKNKPSDLPAVINLYDNRILQMDDYLKRILENLKQKGYLKDFMAVVTADHGQSLGEHGYFGDLRIPLLFFGSGVIPPIPNKFGLQIDIAPTILDLLGFEIPACWKGKSLLKKQGDRWGLHRSPYGSLDKEVAVTYWNKGTLWKYTRKVKASESDLGEWLNNFTRNPGEEKNLITSGDPAFVEQFRVYLKKQTRE